MAEKSFGIKELNLIGASGTPSIDSPNNLNLNAVNVAISTNVSIGGTLSVTGNVSVGGTLTYEDVTNIDSVGLITARNGLNVTAGVSTFAGEIHGNNQRLGSLSNSGRFNGLFVTDGNSYYGSNKLFVSSNTGFGLEAYGDMDSYLKANSGGGTNGNCYMRTGSSSGGYVFVNGDNGVEIHHAGTSNKKFETTSSGATVTGTLTATTFSGSGASLTSLPAANLTGTLPAISGANLTNLPADTPTNSDIQVVYTVTANGSSSYRFAGNGVVSTADNPNLYLIRGQKYRFINNSGGSHPFQIRESSGGTAYSTGVTNNGASSGNIDFAPTFDSPAQIVYQCTSHGGMVGNIYLRDAAGQNRNVGLTTFAAGIDVDGGPINIINGGGAYNTHLNYNDSGQNYITSANGSNTVFRGSNNNVTSLIVHGSGQLDIYDRIRHLGDTDTFMEFSTDTVRFDTAGSERLRIDSNGLIHAKTRSAEVRRMILSGSPSNDAFNIEAHDGESGTSSGDVQGKLGLFYNDGSTLTNTANISFIRGSGAADGAMAFVTNQAERLRINSSGHITPGSNNSQNIGDGTTNFASIWASTRFRGNDDVKLVLGNSQDLIIRHDGNNNLIESPQGHNLYIKSGTGDNANINLARFDHAGAAYLYYNSNQRLITTSTGVDIDGTTDGVLNIDTTDGRGSFIRLKYNGATKVWVGSSEGFGLGDQDDGALMAVGDVSLMSSQTRRITVNSGGLAEIYGGGSSNPWGATFRSDTTGSNSVRCFFEGTNGQANRTFSIMSENGKLRISGGGNSSSSTGTQLVYLSSTSSTSWSSGSDIRLKENVTEISNVLDKVKNYRCARFNFIGDDASDIQNIKFGFIAQDWVSDFPEVLTTSTQDADDPSDTTEYYGMQYTETIPVLLKAIQELNAKVETLQNEVNTLKSS